MAHFRAQNRPLDHNAFTTFSSSSTSIGHSGQLCFQHTIKSQPRRGCRVNSRMGESRRDDTNNSVPVPSGTAGNSPAWPLRRVPSRSASAGYAQKRFFPCAAGSGPPTRALFTWRGEGPRAAAPSKPGSPARALFACWGENPVFGLMGRSAAERAL